MIDAMIDSETLGTEPGCTVLSIGVSVFERVIGDEKQSFYVEIDRASCKAMGLIEDPDTLAWWSRQSPEAQKCLYGTTPLMDALKALTEFYNFCQPQHIWAQGTDFDLSIIRAAYKAVGLQAPWRFNSARDTRTAYDVYRLDARAVPRTATYHNALDDARHQVKCLSIAMRGEHLC